MASWYRKVSSQLDATLFEDDKRLQAALGRLPTKGWNITVLDVMRTRGARGKVIRVESKNPVSSSRWYLVEIVHRPKKPKVVEED